MVRRHFTPERLAELFRYGIATGLSATVTIGLPLLLHEVFAVPERIAVGIAFAAAFVLNFVTTRGYVFRSTGAARNELPRYVITSVCFRLGEYGLFLVLFQFGLVYYAAQIIVVGLSLVLKFLTFKTFVYGRASST